MSEKQPESERPIADTPHTAPQPRRHRGWLKWAVVAFAVVVMVYYTGFFGYHWREEVVLHDGSTIIASRWATRGGLHEIGQSPPIKKMTLGFTHPDSGQRISWKSEATPDVGIVNLKPIALDLVDGTPYLVSVPVGCLAYNKWERPDPPYVLFRFDGSDWQQIVIDQLPRQIVKPNLIISDPDREAREVGRRIPFFVIDSETINKLNRPLRQLEYRSIVRESVRRKSEGSQVGCEKRIGNGKGLWLGEDWFTSQSSLEACLVVCNEREFDEKHCPCKRFFIGE